MLEFFLAILLMLASAWLLGEAVHRLGQPALVGQLLAGVLIGPSVLNVIQPSSSVDLVTVENLALFFIMLLAGLAVRPAKIIAAGWNGAIVSSIAFAIPFFAGVEVAHLFGIGLVSSLTIGLTISITAVPTNAIILMELGLLDTDLGATVIAAGVIDDIISFVALGMIQQYSLGASAAGDTTIELGLAKIGIFLGAFFLVERLIRKNATLTRDWTEKLGRQIQTPGSSIAVILILAVLVSLLAEWSGMQLVIGAFFGGFLASELVGVEKLEKAADVIRGTTFGFFGPFAFAFIGTEFVVSTIAGIPLLVITLLVVAVVSKLAGGYFGAWLSGFSGGERTTIGFLMNSRGFLELVIATTAYQLGLIDLSLFSLVVAVGIIATVISPIASRVAMRRTERTKGSPETR